VFKFYNDMKGRRKSGKSFFKEDMFLIEPDQFYMFHDGESWMAYDKYCFIEPVKPEETYIYKPLSEEPLMGIMRYPNEALINAGIKAGDKVCFKPESEYEFIVDDEKLYRMYDHQITVKL
jgi:hypothetical protein